MSNSLRPWTVAREASLSFTISLNLLKFMSIELVMSSNHLILSHSLLLLPLVFPSIRVFYNELALHIRWPKYWSFSFSISSFNENTGLNIQLYNIYVCVCACALNLSILQLHNCVGWGSPYSSITSS